MFESAELGHKIEKSVFEAEVPTLREALLKAQYSLLKSASVPVIVLVNGVDGAGKGETVNLLNEWMDPRHIHTHAFGPLSDSERDHPEMWRFWQALPPKGHIGILFGSWYTDPILERVMGRQKRSMFRRRLERIRHFERMLVAEGAVIVKFWFHLSKARQKKRLKALAADPKTSWRVSKEERRHFKNYDNFISVCEEALRETSTGEAPWQIIEGSNSEYRSLTAGQLLLEAIERSIAGAQEPLAPPAPTPRSESDGRNLLNTIDYARTLAREQYRTRLEKQRNRLALLTRDAAMRDRALVMVFEGMDAAGKGSSIRRVTSALDARYYHVIPIAAPTDEERAQPYLWRFWRRVPRRGSAVIYDRSWYGRVLVERVESFCAEADWVRAYDEINEFEEQLVDDGAIVVKFWLAISMDEQLRRFREREQTPYKQFKITAEDWRNREKWPLYERAVTDMVERTSTNLAPWHVIGTDDKLLARVEVLKSLANFIEQSISR
ncbi:MAG: polyphosphate:AMP phosphotransferase [Gammaproteobacteria bacterium]